MNRRQQLIKRGEPMDNNIDFSGKTNTDFLNTKLNILLISKED